MTTRSSDNLILLMVVYKNNKVNKNDSSRTIKKLAKSEKISEIWLSLKTFKILPSAKN